MNKPMVHKEGSRWTTSSIFVIMAISFAMPYANAAFSVTQSIALAPGWNAVYVEVDPANPSPESVFSGLPVDAVATYDAAHTGAQFVKDPGVDMSLAHGWAVWYAPLRPDAFLSNLYEIQGGKPYLIHATTNATLSLSGEIAPTLLKWRPDSFNFVGFTVQNPGAPTFAQFFGASPAHNHNRIYRLADGKWRQVLKPETEAMRAGEAFWIYCSGRSDYTGPLEVTAASPFGFFISERVGSELVFRNKTAHPVTFHIEHKGDPQFPVPMSVDIDVLDEAAGGMRKLTYNFPAGNWEQSLPTLEAGGAIRLPIKLRAQEMPQGTRNSIITVLSDLGTKTIVPVQATNGDNQ